MYQQPKKMSTKKKIELVILIFIALWLALFAINYVRYSESKSLYAATASSYSFCLASNSSL